MTGQGLGRPGPHRHRQNLDLLFTSSRSVGTFSTKGCVLVQAFLPASLLLLSPAVPVLESSSSSVRQAFVLRVQTLFPSHPPSSRFQCRLAGPLPLGLAQLWKPPAFLPVTLGTRGGVRARGWVWLELGSWLYTARFCDCTWGKQSFLKRCLSGNLRGFFELSSVVLCRF